MWDIVCTAASSSTTSIRWRSIIAHRKWLMYAAAKMTPWQRKAWKRSVRGSVPWQICSLSFWLSSSWTHTKPCTLLSSWSGQMMNAMSLTVTTCGRPVTSLNVGSSTSHGFTQCFGFSGLRKPTASAAAAGDHGRKTDRSWVPQLTKATWTRSCIRHSNRTSVAWAKVAQQVTSTIVIMAVRLKAGSSQYLMIEKCSHSCEHLSKKDMSSLSKLIWRQVLTRRTWSWTEVGRLENQAQVSGWAIGVSLQLTRQKVTAHCTRTLLLLSKGLSEHQNN